MGKYYVRLYTKVYLDRVIEIEAESEDDATEKANYLGYGSLPIDDDVLNIDNWKKDYLDPNNISVKRIWKKKE